MINGDFNSLGGYRSDGRKSKQLRNTQIEIAVNSEADGSCLFKQGLTQVLCLVKGPYQRPSPNDFLLKIQYTVAPFSSLEVRKSKFDRQFTQFVQNVRRSFEGIILGDQYKKNQIQILVTVIQNGGGAKSAVMNCITIALTNAGIAMKDILVSTTVGTLNAIIMVDPSEQEQYELANQFVISYLRGSGELDCVELRKAKIKEEVLRDIHKVAVASCVELYGRIRKQIISGSLRHMLIF